MVGPRSNLTTGCTVDSMVASMVQVMRLIGSAMALGVAMTAVTWYFVLWPFDREPRISKQ
jgi:hypothetical protein